MVAIKVTSPVIIDGNDYFGGEIVEVDIHVALRLINSGRAEEVTEETPKAKAKK